MGKALVVVAFVAAFSFAAEAQVCVPRPDILKTLQAKYQEQPTAIGLDNGGGVIELLTSPEGASWTMIVTMPNGCTRIIAAGESWDTIPIGLGNPL